MNRLAQRWFESSSGERPDESPMEFLLPDGKGQDEISPTGLGRCAPEPDSDRPRPQQRYQSAGSIFFENRDKSSLSHRMGEGRGEGWVHEEGEPRSITQRRVVSCSARWPYFSLTPSFSEVYARRSVGFNRFSGFPLVLLCALIPLLLTPIAHAVTNDLTTLLQRGLFEEEANRNLDAAISNYQSLANDFDKDRQLAATAIFRLGECYRKLGRTNEAIAQYQRIVHEFSDQQTLATLSQQNLAGLGTAPKNSFSASAGESATLSNLRSQYALLKSQLEQARKETNSFVVMDLFNDNKELAERLRLDLSMVGPDEAMLQDAKSRGRPVDVAQAERSLNQTMAKVEVDRQQIFDFQEIRLRALESAVKEQEAREGMTAQNSKSINTSDTLQELQTDLTKEKASYDQKLTLLNTLQKMSREKLRKALPTLVPDNQFNNLLSELDLAEQNLLQIKADYAPDHPKYRVAKEAVDDLNRKIEDRIYGILTGLQAQLDASKAHQDWIQKRIDLAEQPGRTQTATEAAPITDEEEKEIRRIQAMIQNSPDLINAPSGDPRMTPLRRAAGLGQLRVAKFLLEAKADVNQMDDGQSPLYYAALNGQRAMVQLLLANGADVNAKGDFGYTALGEAAQHGFVSVAETLLAAKADVNTEDSKEYTPLIHAVRGDHLAVAELLLAHGADPNLAATRHSNPYPSGNEDVGAPLHFAVVKGGKPMVSLLLSNHADIELRRAGPFHNTPLEIAAEGGRTDIAGLLLEAGANPNPEPADSEVEPPLLSAAWKGDTNMVSLLLSKGADPNYAYLSYRSGQGYTTALMAAVGHPETATILLRNKADPNFRSIGDGETAFWDGLYNSGAKSLIPLLEYGADPNQTNGYGMSPLMGVANSDKFNSTADRLAVAKLLIEKGANVNAKDKHGSTALHQAVFYNRPEMVELLLANKADVNVADNSGRTPLNIATGPQRPQTPGPSMPISTIRLPGTPSSEGNNANPSSPKVDMVALLREHGALEELPNFNAIRITRQGRATPIIVFQRPSNDWNQVTLFDLLGVQYHLVTASVAGGDRTGSGNYGLDQQENSLPFPDLARVIVHRPSEGGKVSKDLKIDVAKLLDSGNCADDVPLQFGDVVEIPEADHVMNAHWNGLATNELFALQNCLTRNIEVIVKGKTSNVTIAPEIDTRPNFQRIMGVGRPVESITAVRLYQDQPLMLWPVLRDSKLLLASSDLSRIKVKRRDASGKTREWTVDCSDPNSPPNFWLRDGDVIEVPDKPE